MAVAPTLLGGQCKEREQARRARLGEPPLLCTGRRQRCASSAYSAFCRVFCGSTGRAGKESTRHGEWRVFLAPNGTYQPVTLGSLSSCPVLTSSSPAPKEECTRRFLALVE